MFNDKELDVMTLDELETYDPSLPQEIQDKADELLKAFGIALGEARADYYEKLMKEINEENKIE